MEIATLTTTCAEVSTYWSRDVLDIDIGWRITVFLLLIILINVLGVKVGIFLFISIWGWSVSNHKLLLDFWRDRTFLRVAEDSYDRYTHNNGAGNQLWRSVVHLG